MSDSKPRRFPEQSLIKVGSLLTLLAGEVCKTTGAGRDLKSVLIGLRSFPLVFLKLSVMEAVSLE